MVDTLRQTLFRIQTTALRALIVGAVVVAPGALRSEALAQTAPSTPPAATPMVPQDIATVAEMEALFRVLELSAVIEVMRDEGIDYGRALEADLFPGEGGASWQAKVAAIYDPARTAPVFLDRMRRELDGADITTMLDFFGSDLGQRVIVLELSARKALLDEAVEAASKEMRDDMVARGDPRVVQLRRFTEVNDLIESNVSGALNANYAFYRGLVDGGAFPEAMTEDQIMSDVWSQEGDIRTETEDWLYSYLGLAYQPLSDADLADYVTFSETPAAQVLNRALFVAFDQMFVGISRDLGLAAAQFMAGVEL